MLKPRMGQGQTWHNISIRTILIGIKIASMCVADPWLKLQRTPLTNKRPGSGYIDASRTRTVLGCARRCFLYGECRSQFYVRNTGECQTHSTLYTALSPGLIATNSAVYYEIEAASPTTETPVISTITTLPTSTASPCVPTLVVCPVTNETNYFQYNDCNQTFSYRLYFDVTRNFTDAKAECESDGGHLFEILSVEKMNFARQLVQCPDYSSSYFWIDGEYNPSTSAYETSNGEPLPMTQGTFFYIGRPNGLALGHFCIWFDPNMDHLLDDTSCFTNAYMICEKP